MKDTKILLLIVLIGATLTLSGCINQGDQETSLTKIFISDAPVDDFDHINITFSQVKIHKAGDDNDSGWIFFNDNTSKTIDLIYLHENNLSAELGVENLSYGNYTKLWIVIEKATGILNETGENITFDVPSGDLKIQQQFSINEENTNIDVELDLNQSVLYVPQGGVYKLLPVISTVKVDHDDDDEDDEDDDEEEEELEVDAGDDYEGIVGENIEFEGEAEGGVQPYTWNWSFGDGNTSTEQNPTHAYAESGEYNVELIVTDAEDTTASDEATVEINDLPVSGMSFTTVLISDAPSDNFTHINVTFSQVKIHKQGDDNDSGWILFDTENSTVDLIYLHEQNLSEALGVQNLSVGNYSKLWIVVDSATGVLTETGENVTFDVPSGDLKIQQSFVIKEGNTTIDVEIDLERSVLYVPQGGVYKLLPVISTVKVDHDDDDEDDDEEEEELEVDAGDDYEGIVNETIQFEGNATGGVEPYEWYWEFGDGDNSTMKDPEHSYNETGEYTATLTVTDDTGTIASDSVLVTIEEET